MEEIIERLKNKTFTEEDIEKLYDYYKDSENKELAKEVSKLYKFSMVIHKNIKKQFLLCTGCKEFNQFLEYYFRIVKLTPNLINIKFPSDYDYHLNLLKVIELI